ncbi:hypothetical protein QFC22_005262 [Naganishia vaughanmartiniae]|uniref:Uncharacterized protein n=1 Tax=Naganishia vaughanmartiniae TaxID=1424756 RepID=A0ACC2WWI0_9TREE|nr:hypothetical protein QFC22_005262 [Naganishia vaughanmartiniae]
MADLLSVPQDLRECLEALLALDPTPENLDIHLPRVRQIIVTLLSGLKAKQALYRKITGDGSTAPAAAGAGKAERSGEARAREIGQASQRPEPEYTRNHQQQQQQQRPTSVTHSFSSGYSMSGDRASRSGSRSPDPIGGRHGIQQQQQQQQQQRASHSQGTRQAFHQHHQQPPARPELPPPAQMITAASTSASSASVSSSAGAGAAVDGGFGGAGMDRHLSSSNGATMSPNGNIKGNTNPNGSLPSQGARIGAPLPPAPPDAFRPPRRRVTPGSGAAGSATPAASGADGKRSGSTTPTPPMPFTPTFTDQVMEQQVVQQQQQQQQTQNRSLPPVPMHSAAPTTVERQRFALKDEPSPSPAGSPTRTYRPLPTAVAGEGGAEDGVRAAGFTLGQTTPATPPPRRRSHVSRRSVSGGGSQSLVVVGSTGRAELLGDDDDDDAAGPGGQYPMGSRFSLDSEPMDTPKSRRRMTGLTSMSSAAAAAGGRGGEIGVNGGSPPLLPPLEGLPSLEEGLSVDTTSRARSVSPSPSQPIPDTTTTTTEAAAADSPAALASLTALQNSEALGRRASKRFSQYQYKQLLPGHHKGPSSSALRHNRMGSVAEAAAVSAAGLEDSTVVGVPPMPGAQSPVRPARRTVSRTNTGTGTGDDVPPVPPIPQQMLKQMEHDRAEGEDDEGARVELGREERVMQIPRIVAPDLAELDSPTDTVIHHTPLLEAQSPVEAVPAATSTFGSVVDPSSSLNPNTFRVFLQYGRETKKISLDRREVTSIGDLQGLFMNKFEYAPDGMEMFPDVYIKDPMTGIAYHLEDMDDVKPDVLLSLNIDQLDQVKQHFDNTISGLLHEIKELKHNVSQNRRLSAFKPDHSTLSPSVHPADRPSARSPAQVHHVALRPSSPVPAAISVPVHSHTLPTGTLNLHGQLDDVQSLRRDLGAMRQQYVDFVNQSKTAFQTIRDQTQTMREISMTKLSGSRSLLNEGKSALEKDSSEVVRAVEEVSDAIDNVKDDIVRRQILPRSNQMEVMKKNLEEARAHVEKLKQQVSLVAPAWKSTWNEELSTVLEEQRLLKYHESLATDLEGDITQATGIFATLQQYMAQRQQGVGVGVRRQFRAPARETEPTVPNLLLEIRTQETDPNRRLRAIEEQQRARERAKAAKQDDEFSTELTGFVVGRKLKKTGGTEEAERLRMKKQEQQFKRMFNDKQETRDGESVLSSSSPVTPSSAMSTAAPDSPAAGVHPEAVDGESFKEETSL